jgi:hypothetical protein
MIIQVTLIMGLILGTICLLAAVHNFVRHQSFGLGGVVLVAFGAMLLGLSIWQSVELSIDTEGNITATYKQDLGAEAAERNNQLEELRIQIAENTEDIERLLSSVSEAPLPLPRVASRSESRRKFEANSKYSVLVFNKPSQKGVAERVANALIKTGFKSSATPSNLTEARRQFGENEAWVIYTATGKELLPQLKELLARMAPNIRFEYQPDPVNLRRGDVQILLF